MPEAAVKRVTEDTSRMKTYYLPDGTKVRDYPMDIEVSKLINGKRVPCGTRDGNLDKGWLLERPAVLKFRCSMCGKFYDEAIVRDQCEAAHKETAIPRDEIARKRGMTQRGEKPDGRIERLEDDMAELKDMLKTLLKRGS